MQIERHRRRPRLHIGAIAPDRVDLAIVRNRPEGLRPVPRRQHIRRVPLMEERNRRLEFGIGQVGIKLSQQTARAQSLVDHCRGRETRNITRQPRALELLPSQKQTPVESLRLIACNQQVPHRRPRRVRNFAQHFRTHRHWPPLQRLHSLRCEGRLDLCARRRIILRQKDHGYAQRLPVRQDDFSPRQKPIAGNHNSNAHAVARFAVRSHGTAMLQPPKGCQSVLQDFVGRLAGKLRNKTDAAGIEVETGIDKAIFEVSWTLRATVAPAVSLRTGLRRRRNRSSGEAHIPIYDLFC